MSRIVLVIEPTKLTPRQWLWEQWWHYLGYPIYRRRWGLPKQGWIHPRYR